MYNRIVICSFLTILWWPFSPVSGQPSNPEKIKSMIARYKEDQRGPYQDIRWFCKDGTMREARDPCPGEKAGYQHARLKSEVAQLAADEHIFLGQILAGTDNEDFWDRQHAQSRLKQYQIEKYLRGIDNGWVLRKAQYYRGAMQDEDETAWGIDFYSWLLSESSRLRDHFFLIRQSAKDIPHQAETNTIQRVRAISEEIVESYPSFQDLRIKIHGAPDALDSERVWFFQDKNKVGMSDAMKRKFDDLVCGLEEMFKPFKVSDFKNELARLPKDSEAAKALSTFLEKYPTMDCPPDQCMLISNTSLVLRQEMTKSMNARTRLAMLDVSNKMENLLNQEFTRWEIKHLNELLQQVYCLTEAAAAFGYLEMWEWESIKPQLTVPDAESITLDQLNQYNELARGVAEWGASMVRATYMPTIDEMRTFEPMAAGFYDDRVRGSILLHLGQTASRLGDEFSRRAAFTNEVLDLKRPSSIRGLNAGFARGELVVVSENPEDVVTSPDKIYVFQRPPSSLKPVAGIATVTEGNMVSHIQLLARNLGIPNAVVTVDNMKDMESFSGKEVFYAVSNRGTVIMKLTSKMTDEEKKLFEEKKRNEERVTVPTHEVDLYNAKIINLRDVGAEQSGQICGPKAANLGQLKRMFPEHVVEGLVVPFAIFRQHMNQPIAGTDETYWSKMIRIFDHAECLRCSDVPETEIEALMLKQLDTLRTLIKKMPMLPTFRTELAEQFNAVFNQPLGKVPVFVRSDTNMEDLKDFTGAGLNLTVFNVVETEKVYQGIRDVWASPYTERSFKWRQRFMNNPENVYPSILIIPSVDADHSGVMITKGLTTGDMNESTVAFNLGVGGAVDGQAAETWRIDETGKYYLVSPAREPSYRSIPASGGSREVASTYDERILSTDDLAALHTLSQRIRKELPNAPGIETQGPFDIELGFKDDKIWLFQVRPFVENKQAAA
jgi:hypothetical protein